MSIVVPAEGERYFLRLMLKDTVPADLVFILGLFINDIVPVEGTVLSDIVEATYTGYLPVELHRSVWKNPVTVDHRAQSTYGDTFLSFTPDSGEAVIYGYYFRDADSNVLLLAERFVAPATITPTVPVLILPVLRARSEYDPTS